MSEDPWIQLSDFNKRLSDLERDHVERTVKLETRMSVVWPFVIGLVTLTVSSVFVALLALVIVQ